MGIKSFLEKIGKNTVYYPGCLTKYALSAEAENYKKILGKLGADFIILPDILCCGSPVLNAGYETEARKLARKNLEIFKKYNVKKIITNCPACFKTFLKDYKEMLPDWDIEVEHVISVILSYLEKKKIVLERREKVSYHDPCHLGRHLGIYEEPRKILERLGYEVVELRNSRENSLCCGGGAGLKTNNPELANKIARKRVEQARDIGVKKIITPCPLCYAHLHENSEIEVLEFSHVVAEALGIKVEKTDLKKEKCELKEACS
ncbi:MAG: (Fe-S)-binding protein [Nanoarchaeota archaeon]|nr:(Fe-S)-binding protein [Nanoarchaeota archaeon]MBU4086787.1 (Fe-S)-binding protein [Nanoarchaeota archaeon]